MNFKVFYFDSETGEKGNTYIFCEEKPTKEEAQRKLQSECCLDKNKIVKSIRAYVSRPKQRVITEQDIEWELKK